MTHEQANVLKRLTWTINDLADEMQSYVQNFMTIDESMYYYLSLHLDATISYLMEASQ